MPYNVCFGQDGEKQLREQRTQRLFRFPHTEIFAPSTQVFNQKLIKEQEKEEMYISLILILLACGEDHGRKLHQIKHFDKLLSSAPFKLVCLQDVVRKAQLQQARASSVPLGHGNNESPSSVTFTVQMAVGSVKLMFHPAAALVGSATADELDLLLLAFTRDQSTVSPILSFLMGVSCASLAVAQLQPEEQLEASSGPSNWLVETPLGGIPLCVSIITKEKREERKCEEPLMNTALPCENRVAAIKRACGRISVLSPFRYRGCAQDHRLFTCSNSQLGIWWLNTASSVSSLFWKTQKTMVVCIWTPTATPPRQVRLLRMQDLQAQRAADKEQAIKQLS
ncbi:hypothetical protein Anapl_06818 [Anas platyrhynchos]|uniref:Uncharacterized protein n=1 Tax=Anas platyrhynchos TaxID=8839 RepID=R0KCG1_ANAPL|nr:hypothetical protein Anapl_06818 [Anas platyrhynchos]